MAKRKKPIYAFVDAANLFYGGEKSLGWKVDYKKLINYLKEKYNVSRVFYFAGVEIYDFPLPSGGNDKINLNKLVNFLDDKKEKINSKNKESIRLLEQNINRMKFYQKLLGFGYILKLKPTKIFKDANGRITKKANCDVDMTFELMHLMEQYSGAVILSGDGDFAVVLKYLQYKGRKITILARGERTAREMRQLAGSNFRDFVYLRERLRFDR